VERGWESVRGARGAGRAHMDDHQMLENGGSQPPFWGIRFVGLRRRGLGHSQEHVPDIGKEQEVRRWAQSEARGAQRWVPLERRSGHSRGRVLGNGEGPAGSERWELGGVTAIVFHGICFLFVFFRRRRLYRE
jgi:hypothetical protein